MRSLLRATTHLKRKHSHLHTFPRRTTTTQTPRLITGFTPTGHQIDFSTVRVGQKIEIPYETTISTTWRDHWQSVFYQTDRLYTSSKFSTSVGFGTRIPMPFALVMYLASAMSHVDDTRDVFDLTFNDAIYEAPVFDNDTLTKHFTILNITESTSTNDDDENNKNIILNVHCQLFNQNDQRVFSMGKVMYFKKLHRSIQSRKQPSSSNSYQTSSRNFKNHLLSRQERMSISTTFLEVSRGDLVYHSYSRPIGVSASMGLTTQFKMTHPALFNTNRYQSIDNLVVSGPCVVAMVHAAADKELYDILYEEIDEVTFVNPTNPNDCVGAMTYIENVRPLSDKLEEVICTTIGLKNVDVEREMSGIDVPLELFVTKNLKPKDVHDIVANQCPFLIGKIVVVSRRSLLRQSPKRSAPLL